MGRRGFGRPGKKSIVAALLVVSFVVILLPQGWASGLISLVQVLVPFQHAAASAAGSLREVVEHSADPVSAEAYEEVRRAKFALEHQVTALAVRVEELEAEVGLLTATRLSSAGEGGIGARGRLIPARVITDDLLPWRSSRLVNAGSLQGVRRGAPVTSCIFTVDRAAGDGMREGLAVLLGEAVVGIVEHVGTHTSRIKMLSDVSVAMKVRIGRMDGDGFNVIDRCFWLAGRGNGVMEIRDVERREVERGAIKIGDTVLSDPRDGLLPAALTVGRVSTISPDHDNPLLSILTIESEVDEAALRKVYVYDPDTETDAGPKVPRR